MHELGIHEDALQIAEETQDTFQKVFGRKSQQYWRMQVSVARALAEMADNTDTERMDRAILKLKEALDEGKRCLDTEYIQLAQLLLSNLYYRQRKFNEARETCRDLLKTIDPESSKEQKEFHVLVSVNMAVIEYDRDIYYNESSM